MTSAELLTGGVYLLQCGWGPTKARYLYAVKMDGRKTCYHWKATGRGGLAFVSYDLDGVVAL